MQDEVDDSRKTLQYGLRSSLQLPTHLKRSYAVSELQKDVERELLKLPESEREANRTHFAVFVVHNKLKPKAAELPADIPYYPGELC